MKTEIVTFGCRLNAQESAVMEMRAAEAGLQDAIVFNTCAVTREAERQARQAIRKARRARPNAKIIVAGCAAQIDPASFAAMPEVDRVIGNGEKLTLRGFAPDFGHGQERVRVNDITDLRDTGSHLVPGHAERARAFVQVQNGCDHRCTFCIIPYGRGNSRSVAMGDIARQVQSLIESGINEIVLTGVDLTSYGGDLPGAPTLGQMARRLLNAVPDLKRLRLSSLDPAEIDSDLWMLIADEPRLMPHVHLSLQAGDNMILKRMKRRHTREDAIAFCARARALRPDVALGADLIAGFPTETDAMFANTLDAVSACGLVFLHVFPYSARQGTPAARMPQVPGPERKRRAAALREAGGKGLRGFLRNRIGKTETVLIETVSNAEIIGRTEHYASIRLAPDVVVTPGTVVAADAVDIEDNGQECRLVGRLRTTE